MAAEDVRRLHREVCLHPEGMSKYSFTRVEEDKNVTTGCAYDDEWWPCHTIRALDKPEEETSK